MDRSHSDPGPSATAPLSDPEQHSPLPFGRPETSEDIEHFVYDEKLEYAQRKFGPHGGTSNFESAGERHKRSAASASLLDLYQKFLRLTMSEMENYHARFHTFELFQLMTLQRKQHELAEKLGLLRSRLSGMGGDHGEQEEEDEDDGDDYDGYLTARIWDQAERMLEDYCKWFCFSRTIIWTKGQPQVSWAESEKYHSKLAEFTELYGNPLVFDMNPFIDLHPRAKYPDVVRETLAKVLPSRLAANDPKQNAFRKRVERDVEAGKVGQKQKATGEEARARRFVSPPRNTDFVSAVARFLIAVFGGAFLLSPVIAMSYVSTQGMRLVISSVFVIGFSIILSLISTASNQEIVGGVAAYTAVLVVFLGSALPASTG